MLCTILYHNKKRPVAVPTSEELNIIKLLGARCTMLCTILYHNKKRPVAVPASEQLNYIKPPGARSTIFTLFPIR